MAIASMVIGIVFVVATLVSLRGIGFPIPGLHLGLGILGSIFFALPASIAGLVLGIISLVRKSRRGVAITGTVLNALVFLWPISIFIMWGIFGD